MTSRGYFGKMNSTLGSVVPLAMFCTKRCDDKTLSPFAKQDIVQQCNFLLCIDKWSVQLSRICTCVKSLCQSLRCIANKAGGGSFCICICTRGKVCVRVFTVLLTRCRGDGSLYFFL